MFPAPAKTLRPLSLAAAVALTLAGDAHGLSDTWVGNTSVNWADLNWVGGNNPPLTGDLLFFGVAGSAGTELINNLPTPFTAAGITFNSGASPFTFTGNAITLGGNVTNNSTAFQAINFDLALGVARTFTTVAGGGNVSLGGVISGAGGVTKAGPGTLFLANPANTYTGETSFVYNGTAPSIVNVASLSNYGVPSSIGSRTAAQDFTAAQGGSISLRFQGGTLQYTGSTPQSTNREIRLLGNAGVGNINANSNAIDASGSTPEATLSFTHTGTNKNLYEAAGHRSLVLTGTNTGANSFSIRLTDQAPSPNPATTAASGLTNLIKRGPGTWYIRNTDNTYQGETIIEGGILNVASLSDYGVPSSIGSRAAVGLAGSLATAGENTTVTGVGLHFLGGTLQYTGSTPTSTNRNIRVFIGNGATLDASGSVPSATMSFTHTGGNVNLFDTPGVRTITLTGTNTGNNGFSIIIENQSGTATHLTKSGPGTWVLNGPDSNLNSGTATNTNVLEGILSLGKTNATAIVSANLNIGDSSAGAVVQLDSSGTGGNQIADVIVPNFFGSGPTAGILRMNGLNETIGGLNSFVGDSGIVENESGSTVTSRLTLNVTGTQTFGGILRDGDGVGTDGKLALNKTGTGVQIFNGTSTHTGATTVTGGTLSVDGTLGVGTTTTVGSNAVLDGVGTINGPVTINAGGTVSGSGIFTGTVSVANGGILAGTGTLTNVSTVSGSRISPAGGTAAGTISIGTLTLASGSTLDFEVSAGTSDFVNITGPNGLTINGGSFNLYESGGTVPLTANNTYTLLGYNTGYAGSLANLSVGNSQVGKFYAITDNGAGLIRLTVSDSTITEWNGTAADGQWTTAGNWTPSVPPNTPGAVAKFGNLPVAATAIAVAGPKTVGGMLFDNVNAYTLNGGATDTITLNNGVAAASITITIGSHTIAAPIVLATNAVATTAGGTTLTVTGSISGARSFGTAGAGTTVLTADNSYTSTNVGGGTLQVGIGGTTGSLGTGDVTVANGANLIFNRSDNVTVANSIFGTGAKVTKRGAGILTLIGTNTFGSAIGGGLDLETGTVKLGGPNALTNGISLFFTGGTLDLNGNNVNANSLTGTTGTVTDNGVGPGTSILAVHQSADGTFDGSINDGVSRALGLTKTGPAVLTLTGSNSFFGPVLITDGALVAAGAGANVPLVSPKITLGDGNNTVFLIANAPGAQFGENTVLNFANGARDAKFMLRGTEQTLAGIDSPLSNTLSIIQNDEVNTPAGGGSTVAVATLRLNTTTDHSFAGIIRNQTGGGLNLIKDGPATQEIINVLIVGHSMNAITINNGKLAFNLIPNGVQTNTIGGGTVQINTPGVLGLGGEWTLTRVVSGDGTMLKEGTGTVVVNGASDFSGPVNVNGGTLAVALANNTPNPATSALGNMQVVRDITVNTGGTLRFTASDTFGGAGSAVVARVVINAGAVVTNNVNQFTTLGPVLLNGGTLSTSGGNGAGFQSFNFSGDVTTGGTSASTISVNGAGNAFNGFHLNSNTTFNVADATAGSDLNVSAPLINRNATLGGAGGLTKAGPGTMTLSGTSPYTGDTIIAAGSLVVTGTLNGTARVEVQGAGTLGGTGTIIPAAALSGNIVLLSGGKVSPGTGGVGTLASNLSAGGQFELTLGVNAVNSRALLFDLATTAASDRIRTVGGPLVIDLGILAFDDFSFNPLAGFGSGAYTLFDGDQPIIGSFDPNSANLSGTVGGLLGTIEFGDGGNDIVLTVVPEPGAAVSLLCGLGALLGMRRRRSV